MRYVAASQPVRSELIWTPSSAFGIHLPSKALEGLGVPRAEHSKVHRYVDSEPIYQPKSHRKSCRAAKPVAGRKTTALDGMGNVLRVSARYQGHSAVVLTDT
jgi:hypothetical protein